PPFNGLDDKIIFPYVPSMTIGNIQEHLQDLYGIQVSSTLTFFKLSQLFPWLIPISNQPSHPHSISPITHQKGTAA
ncbi:MAG: hypothetical protein ACKO3I_04725, partial [Synechococcales cyanobacterium]